MIATATGQTLAKFAESLMPSWKFPEDWLAWPADTFALTSAVLSRTGAYRHVIDAEWSRSAGWQREAESAAQEWMARISRSLSPARREEAVPPGPGAQVLDEVVQAVRGHAESVSLERLRTLEPRDPEAVGYAEALLKLHAIADEACTGFGVMGPMRRESALAHCLANLLLTAKGSLSQLPKHAGVVLPKLRTPQQGLTLRSLSHHVTYHLTEVEVIWRAMPWPNVDENTINILNIPWPSEVHTQHFEPRGDTFQTVRYFSYWPTQNAAQLPVDRITALVRKIQEEHCRIHVIVFPESALTATEYLRLLAALKQARLEGTLSRVPMVVAGVHRHEGETDFNEVRLAAYYAERWYELSQRKHHRWRLDRNQIRQYGLEGRLATARSWYENISLGQRRLTFLVPNGWLALCPLICEDLAQLEPVSEVIRGVGPTLLFSLLADGPQLPQRWSARYASVLADDPGTAVLTLSSLGMVQKSRRLDGAASEDEKPARTVGLWKDQVMGWKTIDLPEKCDAVLLTVSAELREEYTADGRGDHQSAAAFRFEGVHGYDFPKPDGDTAVPAPAPSDKLVADWGDIRELSAATFAINALLHLRRGDDVSLVLDWLLAEPAAEHKPMGDERLRGLIRQVIDAERDPLSAGISPGPQEQWPTQSLRDATEAIGAFFTAGPDAESEFWPGLVREACSRLERYARNEGGEGDAGRRVQRVIPYSVLTCTYGFLERLRRRKTPKHGEPPKSAAGPQPLATSEAADLFSRVEQALEKFSY